MSRSFELKRLTLETKGEVEAVTLRFPPYCDFNFASLFVWDIDDDTQFARVGENLILELADNKDRSPLYTLMGYDGVADLADDLIARSIADGYGDALRIVPQEVADILANDARFVVSPDPDNDDYVMSAARLAAGLGGSRRSESKRFRETYPNAVLEPLPSRSDADHARLMALLELWAASTKTDPLTITEDRRAFQRALANADRLGLEAVGVAVEDGRLVACELVEILPASGFAVSHFQKIDRRAPGVSSFLNQAVAQWLAARGVEKVNFEQDLGVPGLRNAKRSFQPVGYLRKFTVRRSTR